MQLAAGTLFVLPVLRGTLQQFLVQAAVAWPWSYGRLGLSFIRCTGHWAHCNTANKNGERNPSPDKNYRIESRDNYGILNDRGAAESKSSNLCNFGFNQKCFKLLVNGVSLTGIPCYAGTYAENGTVCTACPLGSFSAAVAANSSTCEAWLG